MVSVHGVRIMFDTVEDRENAETTFCCGLMRCRQKLIKELQTGIFTESSITKDNVHIYFCSRKTGRGGILANLGYLPITDK
jgi:hypothetical protein